MRRVPLSAGVLITTALAFWVVSAVETGWRSMLTGALGLPPATNATARMLVALGAVLVVAALALGMARVARRGARRGRGRARVLGVLAALALAIVGTFALGHFAYAANPIDSPVETLGAAAIVAGLPLLAAGLAAVLLALRAPAAD